MMRSRSARLTLCALAWIALGAAAVYVTHAQSEIDQRRAALRAFELSARDATDALQDVQAGQHAYVSAGQDAREWMTKVAAYLRTATGAIDTLRATALSPASKPSLQDASTATTAVAAIDRRVRGQIGQGDFRQAAEIVYSESEDTASSAVADLESAISTERQAAESVEAGQRGAQIYSLAGVAAIAALVIGFLGMYSSDATPEVMPSGGQETSPGFSTAHPGLALDGAFDESFAERPFSAALSTQLLTRVSGLCTDFGRARSADDLRPLLQQSADLMRARGIIVWLGDGVGGDLRPVLAHGYNDSTLARLSNVSRHADNAAAAAYRTGDVQIVKSRDGAALGAIVAPLLSTDGCIGALTAELRDHGEEGSDDTRALAVIMASQLAGALAEAAAAAATSAAHPSAAAG